MTNFRPSVLALSTIIFISGCSSRVTAPSESKLGTVNYQDKATSVQSEPVADPELDIAVSDGCLKAWRLAIAGKTSEGMAVLEDLEKHRKTSTVQMMMGQIMEHAGNKQAASAHYRQALMRARYNSLYQFKLAESLRTSGDAKGSISEYRSLIKQNPGFVPAHLGLARALLKVNGKSKEACEEVKAVLSLEPQNMEAKALSKQIGCAR